MNQSNKEVIPERPYVITDVKNLEGQRVFKASPKLFKKIKCGNS